MPSAAGPSQGVEVVQDQPVSIDEPVVIMSDEEEDVDMVEAIVLGHAVDDLSDIVGGWQ